MKFLALLEFINRLFSLLESYFKRKTLEEREQVHKEIEDDPKKFFNRGNRPSPDDDQRM